VRFHNVPAWSGKQLTVSGGRYCRLMPDVIDYSAPGPLTDLSAVPRDVLETTASEPEDVCALVSPLVIQPHEAEALGVQARRLDERNLRSATGIVNALLAVDPAPLRVPRAPGSRVVGTCRHFAVLACALLRHRGIPARARCGFATYFQSGKGLDHWVIEYWHAGASQWTRLDVEYLGRELPVRPADLRPGEFLTGGEAWAAQRNGQIDAAGFGVYGTQNWGSAEIRGNAIRDLAALNKVEMLPWDEWGRMTASYRGETGAGYDDLMDEIAWVTAADDPASMCALYNSADFAVPADMLG
jgi:Transglutaminase-like superfamily